MRTAENEPPAYCIDALILQPVQAIRYAELQKISR